MSYIGRKPTVGNFQICDAISVVNGQAAYTMQVGSVNVSPQSANHMIVSLNGTIQKPNSSFTVSGSTITFSSNLVTNDVIDFIQILGDVLDLGVPSDATVTAAKLASDSVTYEKIGYNANQFRNIIINGDMSLAQRATSTASVTGTGYHACDRFKNVISGLGTWTASQSTDVPTGQGFANSFKMDCTTADASPAAGDYNTLAQIFEGQNLQYLKKGTANAESTTLSFWVKSTKTGVNVVSFYQDDGAKQISGSYTIGTSNTWEYKTITFVGNTVNAIANDNTRGFQVAWYLGAGSNRTSGTLRTTWTAYATADEAVGQVNNADSTSNDWLITGVQMEVGPVATPFEHRSYGQELALCQRYFFIGCSSTDAHTGGMANGSFRTTNNAQVLQQHPVAMRTNPTTALRASGSVVIHDTNDGNNINVTAIDAVVMQSIKSTIFGLTLASASGATGDGCWTYSATSTPGITFDAEL